MSEYIEREAALNVNFKIPTRFCESKLTTARKAVQEYANEIAKIPAADVRPVIRANWNTVKYPLYECSNCGAVYQDVGYGFNYCPNCGADMREKSGAEQEANA